ncbi:hypothetical protein V8G54_026714 [Vigna mungo]|uniref:Uncharacterized protein n=1 Tax=Vigna mungo TaxID=3915 RepID=A0AAQ3MZ92_VIGMU
MQSPRSNLQPPTSWVLNALQCDTNVEDGSWCVPPQPERLDIDDRDLKVFLQMCNSSATLIPGPTGNVQATMLYRETNQPKSTHEFANEIAKATYDQDFKSNPWILAENHFGRTYYLNITVQNVVKVFKADTGPPTEELLNTSSRPQIPPHPSTKYNNKNKDVGPS